MKSYVQYIPVVLFIAQGRSNFLSPWVKHFNKSKAPLKWELMNGVPVVLFIAYVQGGTNFWIIKG